jgi:hypothetical protein
MKLVSIRAKVAVKLIQKNYWIYSKKIKNSEMKEERIIENCVEERAAFKIQSLFKMIMAKKLCIDMKFNKIEEMSARKVKPV